MPSSVVKSIASKSGKSTAEVESKWEEAKKLTKKQYPHLGEKDDRFWRIVNSLTHKLSGVKESVMTENLKTQHPNAFVVDKQAGAAYYEHPDHFVKDAEGLGATVSTDENGTHKATMGDTEIGKYHPAPVDGMPHGFGKIQVPAGAAPYASGNNDVMMMTQGQLVSGGDMDAVGMVGEADETLTESPGSHLSAKRRSAIAKKAKKGKDVGHGHFKDVEAKAAKEYGSKAAGRRVAAAAMWKHAHEGVEPTEIQLNEYLSQIDEIDGQAPGYEQSKPDAEETQDSPNAVAPKQNSSTDEIAGRADDEDGAAPRVHDTMVESRTFFQLVTEELAAVGDHAVVMKPFSHDDYVGMIGDLTGAAPDEVVSSWNEAASQNQAQNPDLDPDSDEFNALVAMDVLGTFNGLGEDEDDENSDGADMGAAGTDAAGADAAGANAVAEGLVSSTLAGIGGAVVGGATGALVGGPLGAAVGAGAGAVGGAVVGADKDDDEDEHKNEAFAPELVGSSNPMANEVPSQANAEAPASKVELNLPQYKDGKLVVAPTMVESIFKGADEEDEEDEADEDEADSINDKDEQGTTEAFAPSVVSNSTDVEGHPVETDDSAPTAHKDEDNDFPQYKNGKLLLAPSVEESLEESISRKEKSNRAQIHGGIKHLTALTSQRRALKAAGKPTSDIDLKIRVERAQLNSLRG